MKGISLLIILSLILVSAFALAENLTLQAKLNQRNNAYQVEVQRVLSFISKSETETSPKLGELFQMNPQLDQVQMYGD